MNLLSAKQHVVLYQDIQAGKNVWLLSRRNASPLCLNLSGLIFPCNMLFTYEGFIHSN